MKRRNFIKSALTISSAAGLSGFPLIIPGRLFGRTAPSNKITVGCIGLGRMGLGDMQGFLSNDEVQVIAVCDVDRKRAGNARTLVDNFYQKKGDTHKSRGCAIYHDFRDLLARDDIDVVSISTPDHWHAIQGIAAARAGKDIFVQKPLCFTITEGRALSEAVVKYNSVLQVGSQQRSDSKFRFAVGLVRNGRIGELRSVKVGIGKDLSCDPQPIMPVPENLDYDFWQGPAQEKPYTETRVHPQHDYSRPGWMRIQEYGLGMISNWGAHHLDIAQWGMGLEQGGPVEVSGKAKFPKDGLWNVHLEFNLTYRYQNGVTLSCADNSINQQGVRFEGDDGWVYVRRGFIDTYPKNLLKEKFMPNEVHVYESNDHKKNFIECVKSRKETVAPVETGHRSFSVCSLGFIAMQLGKKLEWDPQKEQFINDPEASRFLSRPMRGPWNI